MKTEFTSINDLKKNITEGQPLYLENYINPSRSRVTRVKRKQSYFFTVENADGKESWVINGATEASKYGFNFNGDKVDIFTKHNNMPFVSLYFNATIIKGKSNLTN